MALCDDIFVAADGTVCGSDTSAGRILLLKEGGTTLETWATAQRWNVKGPAARRHSDLGEWQHAGNSISGKRGRREFRHGVDPARRHCGIYTAVV